VVAWEDFVRTPTAAFVLSEGERRQLGRKIAAVCRSNPFYDVLSLWGCGALDGGCLMVAEALRQALNTGEVWGLYGYPLSPPRAATVWQHAVLRLAPNSYVDGDGISGERALRRRWLAHEMTIITDLTPLPPMSNWPGLFPDTPFDQSTSVQLADLFRRKVLA